MTQDMKEQHKSEVRKLRKVTEFREVIRKIERFFFKMKIKPEWTQEKKYIQQINALREQEGKK